MAKVDIRKLNDSELADFLIKNNEKEFRIRQIGDWLWKKSVTDFDVMSNLSIKLRELLNKSFSINNVVIDHTQVSADGTIKSAFRLYDDHFVEGVLIPSGNRLTACISSQVGCSLSCKFCATGYLERKRNLDAAEIYDQVVLINKQAQINFGKSLTNIVYMGMGEPLLNYGNVMKSIYIITSEEGLNMSSGRITLSTAGIAKMIVKLGEDKAKFNLALSLHAADDEKRNIIMPINETNSLPVLRDALQFYYKSTKKPVTFEYILLNKFNDSIEDAKKLVRFTRHFPSKVNIIEYNTISEAAFTKTNSLTADIFRDFLNKNGVNARIRRSRGKDIDAACGQLANKI